MNPQSLLHLTKTIHFSLSGRVSTAQTFTARYKEYIQKLPPPKGKAMYVMNISLPEMDR